VERFHNGIVPMLYSFLWKAIPIAGALVGGSFDFFTTSVVANRAKKTFAKNGINVGEGITIDKSDC
jgi:hypothetical protein